MTIERTTTTRAAPHPTGVLRAHLGTGRGWENLPDQCIRTYRGQPPPRRAHRTPTNCSKRLRGDTVGCSTARRASPVGKPGGDPPKAARLKRSPDGTSAPSVPCRPNIDLKWPDPGSWITDHVTPIAKGSHNHGLILLAHWASNLARLLGEAGRQALPAKVTEGGPPVDLRRRGIIRLCGNPYTVEISQQTFTWDTHTSAAPTGVKCLQRRLSARRERTAMGWP